MITWVLLRGLTREAGHWKELQESLGSRLPAGNRVFALDLPGNGSRYQDRSPWTVPAMARACRAEMAKQGVEPPFVLVAMSLGAMAALEWAYQAPEQVAGGVVINMSLRGTSAPWQRLRPRNLLHLLRLLRPGLPATEREAIVLAMTSSDPARHPDAVARWTEIADRHPVSRGNALRQLAAAARYAPPQAAPPVPLLVLGSNGDRLVSPHCSRRFAARWDLPLRMHPAAGHDLPLDAPDWVLDQITAWWKSRT